MTSGRPRGMSLGTARSDLTGGLGSGNLCRENGGSGRHVGGVTQSPEESYFKLTWFYNLAKVQPKLFRMSVNLFCTQQQLL